jgi:hypothetical protein
MIIIAPIAHRFNILVVYHYCDPSFSTFVMAAREQRYPPAAAAAAAAAGGRQEEARPAVAAATLEASNDPSNSITALSIPLSSDMLDYMSHNGEASQSLTSYLRLILETEACRRPAECPKDRLAAAAIALGRQCQRQGLLTAVMVDNLCDAYLKDSQQAVKDSQQIISQLCQQTSAAAAAAPSSATTTMNHHHQGPTSPPSSWNTNSNSVQNSNVPTTVPNQASMVPTNMFGNYTPNHHQQHHQQHHHQQQHAAMIKMKMMRMNQNGSASRSWNISLQTPFLNYCPNNNTNNDDQQAKPPFPAGMSVWNTTRNTRRVGATANNGNVATTHNRGRSIFHSMNHNHSRNVNAAARGGGLPSNIQPPRSNTSTTSTHPTNTNRRTCTIPMTAAAAAATSATTSAYRIGLRCNYNMDITASLPKYEGEWEGDGISNYIHHVFGICPDVVAQGKTTKCWRAQSGQQKHRRLFCCSCTHLPTGPYRVRVNRYVSKDAASNNPPSLFTCTTFSIPDDTGMPHGPEYILPPPPEEEDDDRETAVATLTEDERTIIQEYVRDHPHLVPLEVFRDLRELHPTNRLFFQNEQEDGAAAAAAGGGTRPAPVTDLAVFRLVHQHMSIVRKGALYPQHRPTKTLTRPRDAIRFDTETW